MVVNTVQSTQVLKFEYDLLLLRIFHDEVPTVTWI